MSEITLANLFGQLFNFPDIALLELYKPVRQRRIRIRNHKRITRRSEITMAEAIGRGARAIELLGIEIGIDFADCAAGLKNGSSCYILFSDSSLASRWVGWIYLMSYHGRQCPSILEYTNLAVSLVQNILQLVAS